MPSVPFGIVPRGGGGVLMSAMGGSNIGVGGDGLRDVFADTLSVGEA